MRFATAVKVPACGVIFKPHVFRWTEWLSMQSKIEGSWCRYRRLLDCPHLGMTAGRCILWWLRWSSPPPSHEWHAQRSWVVAAMMHWEQHLRLTGSSQILQNRRAHLGRHAGSWGPSLSPLRSLSDLADPAQPNIIHVHLPLASSSFIPLTHRFEYIKRSIQQPFYIIIKRLGRIGILIIFLPYYYHILIVFLFF